MSTICRILARAGHQCEPVVAARPQALGDEVHGVAILERHGGLGHLEAFEAAAAVDLFGGYRGAGEWPPGAGIDRHLVVAAELAEKAGVALGELG
jgi:hypothetical protein